MKSIIRIIAITMFLTGTALLAQAPAPAAKGEKVQPKTPYSSDRAQLAVAREELLQLRVQQLQQQIQQEYAQEENFLKSWEASVKAANKWGDDVTYDRATDAWYKAEKPAEVKPALKK